MANLFSNPKQGDKVLLIDRKGNKSQRRIFSVTPRTIRVSGCNQVKFRRDGSLHKRHEFLELKIRPVA